MWEPLSPAATGPGRWAGDHRRWGQRLPRSLTVFKACGEHSITQLKSEHAVACRDRYDLLPLALVADRVGSNNTSQVLPPDLLPIGGIQRKEMAFVAASKHQLPGC